MTPYLFFAFGLALTLAATYYVWPEFERQSNARLAVYTFIIGLFLTLIFYGLSRSLYEAWYEAAIGADELRASQAALTSRESELNTVLTNTPDVVSRFDRELRFLYMNHTGAVVTGIADEAFPGKTSRELGFPSADLWEHAISRVFGTALPYEIEFSLIRGESVRHFQDRLVPEHAADGSVSSVLSVARDITGLKLAEESQKRNAAHMQLLADLSRSFAAAQLDMRAVAQTAVHFVTEHMADVAVVTLVDGDGKNIIPVGLAHVDPAVEARMRATMDEQPVPLEGGLLGAAITSGETLLVSRFDTTNESIGHASMEFFANHPISSIMIVPLKVSGRTIGALGVGRLNQNHPFGDEDQGTIRDVADRAALAVENARLYDEAQRAIRMRDEFLSIASHELKTPLTPLQLQVQNLQRLAAAGGGQIAPARLLTFASVTERQVQRLTHLVNSLLDVSRIGAGKFELEPESFDLVEAVREVIERFALEAERTGTPLRLEAAAPVVGTWDRLRIEQVITNLVSNALKYGEHQPILISCALHEGWADLRVTDHGIGLPAGFVERAFERFTRAVSTRSYGGLGLGLYIVKQIVMAHGGEVAATSDTAGTTFAVRLPLAPAG